MSPTLRKTLPLMHVSILVLVESLFLLLILGSHPNEQKGFLVFIYSFKNITWDLK